MRLILNIINLKKSDVIDQILCDNISYFLHDSNYLKIISKMWITCIQYCWNENIINMMLLKAYLQRRPVAETCRGTRRTSANRYSPDGSGWAVPDAAVGGGMHAPNNRTTVAPGLTATSTNASSDATRATEGKTSSQSTSTNTTIDGTTSL